VLFFFFNLRENIKKLTPRVSWRSLAISTLSCIPKTSGVWVVGKSLKNNNRVLTFIGKQSITVGKIAEKAVCRSVLLTTWHCILSAELTEKALLCFFWWFCPRGLTYLRIGILINQAIDIFHYFIEYYEKTAGTIKIFTHKNNN